jgi:hypothetical protein
VSDRYRSTEEVLARDVRDMGEDLGRVYNELSSGLSRLQVKWGLYTQLYSRSSERIDLINQAAGWFFRVVQGALIGDVLLHIARLTDREQIRGRDNLTIRRLPALVPEALRADVTALEAAATMACKPIREWRNRRGAHTDLKTAIFGIPEPDITGAQVEAALASLRALLNRIGTNYSRAPTMYEHIGTPPGDADALVYYLLKGIRADEARHRRLLEGKPLPEDLEREDDLP